MKKSFLPLSLCSLVLISGLASCQEKVLPFEGRALAYGKVGIEYEESIANGNKDMYYDIDYDSSLPSGLILYDDGTLKGTPKEKGDFAFRAVMIDFDDNEYYADFTLSIAGGEITYTSFALPEGKTGEAYEAELGTATGMPDITYSLDTSTTLPKGLSLEASGRLSGIPTETCKDLPINILASAQGADPVKATFSLTIQEGEKQQEDLGKIVFDDFTLPEATVGTPYSESIRKAYGVPNITYTIRFSAGQGLPKGMKSDKDLGLISGTPEDSTEGTIAFRVIASAEGYESKTAYVTLEVKDVYVATTTFETEYVDSIPHLSGAGYSSAPSGRGMIQKMSHASNQHVLGYLNKPASIAFKIYAKKATTATLAVTLGSEIGDFTYDSDMFGISVNGTDLAYGSIVVTQTGTTESTYEFTTTSLSPSISLNSGLNTIQFDIKASSKATGTFTAVGCLFDCISLSGTSVEVGWYPRVANVSD